VTAPGWAAQFFRGEIFTPDEPAARAQAPAEARFALRALGLAPGGRLLDVCCGSGRHALLFAKRGILVTGVDVTPEYLRIAKRRAGSRRNPSFVLGDMRRLPFRGEFDAAVNLWTSFGYFASPADDLRALRSIARALKPGGRLLIDVINPAWLRANFQARQWRPGPRGSIVCEEARLLAGRDPRVESVWTVARPGLKWASAPMMVRLYDERRLSRALMDAGFAIAKRWGGLDGRTLSEQSSRLVVLARKR